MNKNTKVVCLGGGVGTVNLIRGLKKYTTDITVVASIADEGGSSGRLRRLYKIFPAGDMISCMAALCDNPLLSKLLVYRFPGDRYGKDADLPGHKLGNLIVAALEQIEGDFQKAINDLQELFKIQGKFFPATSELVTISAKTIEGKIVEGEETIDLGKYDGERVLEEVFLHPKDAKAPKGALLAIKNAQVIIAGPGDLYTTTLPALIVKEIQKEVIKSKAKKLFVVNVANKPFETKDYEISDYIKAIEKHLGTFPFDTIIANNNFSVNIPGKYQYSFVNTQKNGKNGSIKVEYSDLVEGKFPLYHSSEKLAKAIARAV